MSGRPKLTAKMAAFVAEYLVDLNASAAARRAGYSERTAFRIGQENLQKPAISAAIALAMAERAQAVKVDAEWVLRRLHAEATADVSEILDDDGNVKPVSQWPKVFRTGLVAGLEVVALPEGGGGMIKKIKLADRTRLLEMIGKHVDVAAFRDRVEHSGKLDLGRMSEAELDAEIEAHLAKGRAVGA